MKRLIFVAIIFITSIITVACDPLGYYLDYDKLKENLVMIELINYDNPTSKRINGYKQATKPFDFEKMEVLETLSEDKVEQFLESLSSFEFHLIDKWEYKYSDSANGIAIIVRYNNGDFLVLDCGDKSNFLALYDSKGQIKEHNFMWTSSRDFENGLVNKYFTAYHFDGYSR